MVLQLGCACSRGDILVFLSERFNPRKRSGLIGREVASSPNGGGRCRDGSKNSRGDCLARSRGV